MTDFWSRKRVCVTGGAGFLGSYVVESLKRRGCQSVFVPRRADYDLVDGDAVRPTTDHAPRKPAWRDDAALLTWLASL